MPEETSPAKFLTGNLLRHVTVMSFTASIGLMAIFAVDLIDLVFISMLGSEALAAAVGFAGTLLFFTNSTNIGISVAAGVMVAKSLGAGNADEARNKATAIAMIGVSLAVLIAIFAFIFAPQLIGLLGAEGEVQSLAARYTRILLLSMPAMTLGFLANAILRAHGDARRAMVSTVAGAVVNAVLDPILIFGFSLGLDGAALATTAARITIFLTSLLPVIRVYHGLCRPKPSLMKTYGRESFSIAVPSILTNVATPVGTAIVTREMAKFGTDAVAGSAIIGRLTPVAFSVVFALSGAVGPIIGQNFGAKQFDRVRETLRDSIRFLVVYVAAVSLLLFLLRAPIANLFNAEGEARQLIYLFCGFLSLSYVFNGVIFVANASFNNLGFPIYSTYINWGRNTIGTLPFVLLGASLWGASGVLIGQALGGVVFAILAVILANKVVARAEAGEGVHEPSAHAIRRHILSWRGRSF